MTCGARLPPRLQSPRGHTWRHGPGDRLAADRLLQGPEPPGCQAGDGVSQRRRHSRGGSTTRRGSGTARPTAGRRCRASGPKLPRSLTRLGPVVNPTCLLNCAPPPRISAGATCVPLCAGTCTRTPTGPTAAADRGDGLPPGAGPRVLVLTDHSPRLTVANGLWPARLTKQLGVVDEVNEHLAASASSRASRSTSSTTAVSTRPTSCWPGSTSRSPACIPSCEDAAAMTGGCSGPSATRAPTSSGTAPAGWSWATAAPGRAEFDAEGGLRGVRRARHGGRDQLPARAPGPADQADRAGPRPRLPVLDRLRRHAPGQLDFLDYGASAPRPRACPDRIVNTWPADKLLDWTASN